MGPYAQASSSIRPSSFVTRAITRTVFGSIAASPALLLTQTTPFGAAAMPTTRPPPSVGRSSVATTCRAGFVSSTDSETLVPTHSFPRCHSSARIASDGAPFAVVHAGEKCDASSDRHRPRLTVDTQTMPSSSTATLVAADGSGDHDHCSFTRRVAPRLPANHIASPARRAAYVTLMSYAVTT